MRIFLAGVSQSRSGSKFEEIIKQEKPFVLESFYYADTDMERLLPYFGDFMLDSGAFTFMQNAKTGTKWEEYVERYADFIKRHKVEKFFELDIDSVIGYGKVLEFRQKLETLTGRQCIPVWHKSRGVDEFKRMCDEYGYVAIGGIVSKEITQKQYQNLPILIKEAHYRKSKIHGLGFTNLMWLKRCHFDSVDSTRWNCGRFGRMECFDGQTMRVRDWRKENKRLKTEFASTVAERCFDEWIKFQKWAEVNM